MFCQNKKQNTAVRQKLKWKGGKSKDESCLFCLYVLFVCFFSVCVFWIFVRWVFIVCLFVGGLGCLVDCLFASFFFVFFSLLQKVVLIPVMFS